MVLLGVGAGVGFNPVLLAAMGDVGEHESGLASGIVNTSFLLGGALLQPAGATGAAAAGSAADSASA
jgi:hypothetical protein